VSATPAPPPRTVRVALEGGDGAALWVTILHFKIAGAALPTAAQMDAFAQTIFNLWSTRFKPYVNGNTAWLKSTATFWVDDETTVVGVYTGSVGGTMTGTILPASTAQCISWRIAAASYRGGHARTYLSAPTATALGSNQSFTPTHANNLATAASLFRSDASSASLLSAGDVTFGILRRVRDKTVLDPPEFHPIVGSAVDQRVDSQRRRLGPDR
jgi:hypothetical protein